MGLNIEGGKKFSPVLGDGALASILGVSREVNRLRGHIKRIAVCDVTVLISGESGTGKELAARALHYLSSRSRESFVPVNCGAIPDNLVENELFGHVRGAFTDAVGERYGVVTEAEGGTLFLDEIGSLNPYLQVKLLRLLQEKEYKALGDSKTRKADIRIVAATNQNLKAMVDKGEFREDLYFRLNIVALDTPPLRDRKEDIPMLVNFFIEKYARQYNKAVKVMTDEAMVALLNYSWPGNIRELENKIQSLMVMVPSIDISSDYLQLPRSVKSFPPADGRSFSALETGTTFDCFKTAKQKAVEAFEMEYLTKILTQFNGNVTNAARTAGKSRTAFWNLLAKYSLSPKEFQ